MAMNVCEVCNNPVHRSRFTGGKFVGIDCGCLREKRMRTAFNPFADLTIEHISDEAGNKLRVTSLRQLQEAEKRYSFASVVANFDAANVDDPPQQKVFSVRDMYREKFAQRRG